MLDVAVELADEPVAILGGALGQIVDKGFDLLSTGLPKCGSSAVIGRIRLYEASIKLVLANQEAESIAEARLAVVMAIISVRVRLGLIKRGRRLGSGRTAKFFDRTKSNAIGLSESAIDGAGFRDAHLSAMDQGGDVGRIGVAEADETA